MSHCKHEWEDRTQVLRTVFHLDDSRRGHEYFVCVRCLRIDEVRPEAAPIVTNPFDSERAA